MGITLMTRCGRRGASTSGASTTATSPRGDGTRAATPAGDRPRRSLGVRSAGLAVRGVLATTRAELGQLEPVGVVAAVLLGDVVALLAVHARERDLGANVGALAGHGKSFCSWSWVDLSSGGGTRTRDTTIMSRVL